MAGISNPEAFQLEAAAILAGGYKNFPSSFGWGFDLDTGDYPTEAGRNRAQIQHETIIWLKDNGYLYGGGFYGEEQWRDLKLTERALAVLNSVPDALSGKEPLGKRLVAAVGKGSVDTIKQLIPAVIQQAIIGS